MQQKLGRKICILSDSLSGGGAEKMAANLSNEFYKLGLEVFVVILINDISYDFSGKLYNVGKSISNIKIINRIQRIIRMKKAFSEINADYYIDFRYRKGKLQEGLFHLLVFPSERMIFTIHSFQVECHIPKGVFFEKFYKKAHCIVSVSKKIDDLLVSNYGFRKTKVIYNFYLPNYNVGENILVNNEFVIAVARLDPIKQLDRLIEAYLNSILPKKGIPLYIFGEGEERCRLEKLIKKMDASNLVKLFGFSENVSEYMALAKFLLLSSKQEGMPMVLIESLNLGTPVISFDCNSGPSEIISHRENGLLVKNQDFGALTKAMNLFVTNEKLYSHCKSRTKKYIEPFSKERVMLDWLELLK